MGDLEQLRERVMAATGPDRRLDVAVHVVVTNSGRLGDYASVDEYTNSAIQLGWNTPSVTSSVDAVLAIVGRRFPGWSWKIVGEPGSTYGYCAVLRNAPRLSDVANAFVASQRTAPLAILAATLSALAKEPTP